MSSCHPISATVGRYHLQNQMLEITVVHAAPNLRVLCLWVVTELFDLFMSETNILPHDWQVSNGTPLAALPPDKRARIIADYIASMTDRYAIIEHQRLFDLAPVFK